jgi:hypothetical protein
MRGTWATVVTVVLALVLSAPSLKAQERRSTAELERLSQEAMAAAGRGDFEGAIRIWEDILDEVPTDTSLDLHVNIGVAYQRLKKVPEAWYHLDRYVRGTEVPDAKVSREARKLAKSLAKDRVKTSIGCTPEGATLYFGDKAQGTPYPCPLTWYLAAGSHSIYVTMKEHEPAVHKLTIDGKTRESYQNVTLEARKLQHGELVIEGNAQAVQVFLNGELEGSVPFKRKLKPGTYELMVGKPGKLPWKKRITVNAGQTVVEKPAIARGTTSRVVKDDTKKNGGREFPVIPDNGSNDTPGVTGRVEEPSRVLEWTIAGGGAALLAAGVVCAAVAWSKDGSLQDKYPADQSLPYDQFAANQQKYSDAYNDEVYPLGLASYALVGVGAAAAITGGVLLLLNADGEEGRENPAAVYPMLHREAWGLGVSLVF